MVCPTLWGLPQIEHLAYLLLLEKGDEGVDTEETKNAGQAISDLHSALAIAIGVVLNKVRGDEGSRGAVCDVWARVVPVLVRDCRELHVGVRLH